MLFYVSFFITSNKKWNAEDLKPSIRSHPEGPKYGGKLIFEYSGRHQVHLNFQPFPPPPYPHVAITAKESTAATTNSMCNI
jgi:hypothetical protein